MDGKYLASGAENGLISIFDVENDYKQTTTFKHDNQVVSLRWHQDMPILLSTSADNSAILWSE